MMKTPQKIAQTLILFTLLSLIPQHTGAGEFRVTPIRLFFENGARTGVLTIMNEGNETLNLQIKSYVWAQDQNGKDQYQETDDIIFFPKFMKLEKNERQIIRTGLKNPSSAMEKTYRLFIKEVPDPKSKSKGTNIEITVRFGVPIFIKPVLEELKGEIHQIQIKDKKLHFSIKNAGNAHFRIGTIVIQGVDKEGSEQFSKELKGWYLLAGAQRPYETPLSQDICQEGQKINVEVKTDQFTLQDQFDVSKIPCLP